MWTHNKSITHHIHLFHREHLQRKLIKVAFSLTIKAPMETHWAILIIYSYNAWRWCTLARAL